MYLAISDASTVAIPPKTMPAIARQLLARGYATAATAVKVRMSAHRAAHAHAPQAPLQLNSLTGTYATSTYLAALKKSPKDLEALAKDVEAFDRKIKEDAKVAAFIRTCTSPQRVPPRSSCPQKTPPSPPRSDPPPSHPSSPRAPPPSSPTSSPSSPRTVVSLLPPRSLPTSTRSWLPTGVSSRSSSPAPSPSTPSL